MTKTTDLEVYLLRPDLAQLESWLNTHLDDLAICLTDDQKFTTGRASFNGNPLQIKLYKDTPSKNFYCLWLDNPSTPWENDLTLARELSNALNIETRCAVENWHEGGEMDSLWWKIRGKEEKQINW